jgi:hypothetical protein
VNTTFGRLSDFQKHFSSNCTIIILYLICNINSLLKAFCVNAFVIMFLHIKIIKLFMFQYHCLKVSAEELTSIVRSEFVEQNGFHLCIFALFRVFQEHSYCIVYTYKEKARQLQQLYCRYCMN